MSDYFFLREQNSSSYWHRIKSTTTISFAILFLVWTEHHWENILCFVFLICKSEPIHLVRILYASHLIPHYDFMPIYGKTYHFGSITYHFAYDHSLNYLSNTSIHKLRIETPMYRMILIPKTIRVIRRWCQFLRSLIWHFSKVGLCSYNIQNSLIIICDPIHVALEKVFVIDPPALYFCASSLKLEKVRTTCIGC